jgi:hypothetical protein
MEARLADIVEITMGVAPAARSAGGARFVQIKDLTLSRRALVSGPPPEVGRASPIQPDDVLFAARGEPAPVALADEGLWGAYPTADVYLLRAGRTGLDPGFLVALLRSDEVQSLLRQTTGGTVLPRISKKALEDLEVILPPLERQRQIGALARLLDRRVELLDQRLNAERRWRAQLLNQLIKTS